MEILINELSLCGQFGSVEEFILTGKTQLAKLFENPYWEDNPKHAANCVYVFKNNNVCSSSF